MKLAMKFRISPLENVRNFRLIIYSWIQDQTFKQFPWWYKVYATLLYFKRISEKAKVLNYLRNYAWSFAAGYFSWLTHPIYVMIAKANQGERIFFIIKVWLLLEVILWATIKSEKSLKVLNIMISVPPDLMVEQHLLYNNVGVSAYSNFK